MIQGDGCSVENFTLYSNAVKDFEWFREQDVEDCSNS